MTSTPTLGTPITVLTDGIPTIGMIIGGGTVLTTGILHVMTLGGDGMDTIIMLTIPVIIMVGIPTIAGITITAVTIGITTAIIAGLLTSLIFKDKDKS